MATFLRSSWSISNWYSFHPTRQPIFNQWIKESYRTSSTTTKRFCCVGGLRPWTSERSSSSHCMTFYTLFGVLGSRSATLRSESVSRRPSLLKWSTTTLNQIVLNCSRSAKLCLPTKRCTRANRSSCLTFLKPMSTSRLVNLSHWKRLRKRCYAARSRWNAKTII